MECTITFTAEAVLIEQAQRKARRENTALNEVFKNWLHICVQDGSASPCYAGLMRDLHHVSSGRSFLREEANER